MPFETSDLVRNGKYTDVQHLAFGAYGRVCSARDRLGRLVAVKELAPGTLSPQRFAEFCERFQREFKLQHSLRDDHIIFVIDLEKDAQTGEWYSICELADKKSLADHLNVYGVLSEEDALSVALDICVALEKIWSVRVVHRDVKPGNILLCTNPNHSFPLAKLGDFGSAYEPKQTIVANKPVDVHLTPEYAPPQFVPGNPLFNPSTLNDPYYTPDIRFDIYSLGITLWEMLTRKNYKDLVKVGPPSLQQHAPKASLEIAQVIRWALEEEPDKRYQLPEDLKADLQRVRDGKAPVGPQSRPAIYSAANPKSFSIIRTLLVSIVIFIVAGTGLYIFRAFNPDHSSLTTVATSTSAIVAIAPATTLLPTTTMTAEPPTPTSEPPTPTPEPPTPTSEPPTPTSEPPTPTPEPPTRTLVPPSVTPEPPTTTPEPPTITPGVEILPPNENVTIMPNGLTITIVGVRFEKDKLRVKVNVQNNSNNDLTVYDHSFRLDRHNVVYVDNNNREYGITHPLFLGEDALPARVSAGRNISGEIEVDRELEPGTLSIRLVFNYSGVDYETPPIDIPER